MSHPSADPIRREPPGHLSAERLAALASESPTPAEVAHLEHCAPCGQERAAAVALLELARAERARVAPPLTDWGALSAALRAERLVAVDRDAAELAIEAGRGGPPVHLLDARRAPRRAIPVWLGRAAAAALFLVVGGAAGRMSAGADPLPVLRGSGSAAPVVAVADTAATPRSAEEAMAVLGRAERDYRVATAFLAAQADPAAGLDSPELYQRRLAVMDEVAALTRAALYEAPHDPVLNQYYLASLGAREATLQQLGIALPQGTQLNRF